MALDLVELEKEGLTEKIKLPPLMGFHVHVSGLESDQGYVRRVLANAIGMILYHNEGPRALIKWSMIKRYVFAKVKSSKDRKLIERYWWRIAPSSIIVDGDRWHLRMIDTRGQRNRIKIIYEDGGWKWKHAKTVSR